jgi:hypothetical protein
MEDVMAGQPIGQLTLRELLIEAERTTRELFDHLKLNLLPKANSLRKLVRPSGGQPYKVEVQDVTVRSQVKTVMDSEEFAANLLQKLSEYSQAIDESTERIRSG